MDPVPYEIGDEDIDEVLTAHGAPDEVRAAARTHVRLHLQEIGDEVRSAAEDPYPPVDDRNRAAPVAERPGEQSPARREMALAAIEDLLIRDRFLDVSDDSGRVFPVSGEQNSERRDA